MFLVGCEQELVQKSPEISEKQGNGSKMVLVGCEQDLVKKSPEISEKQGKQNGSSGLCTRGHYIYGDFIE
jgi:hypothetical protein